MGLTLLAALLVAGIGALTFADRWEMWRLRRTTEDSGHKAYELCQRGREVLPMIYDAFDEHGAEPDVADFRVVVADVLSCVRRGEGSTTNVDNAYRDLPADDVLVADAGEVDRGPLAPVDFFHRLLVVLQRTHPHPLATRQPLDLVPRPQAARRHGAGDDRPVALHHERPVDGQPEPAVSPSPATHFRGR